MIVVLVGGNNVQIFACMAVGLQVLQYQRGPNASADL